MVEVRQKTWLVFQIHSWSKKLKGIKTQVSDGRRSWISLIIFILLSFFYILCLPCSLHAVGRFGDKTWEKKLKKNKLLCVSWIFPQVRIETRLVVQCCCEFMWRRGKKITAKVWYTLASCKVRMKTENIAADEHSCQLVHLFIALFFQFWHSEAHLMLDSEMLSSLLNMATSWLFP